MTTEIDAVEQVQVVAEEYAAETDVVARFPVEALDVMRRTKLLGLMVPGQFGGSSGTLTNLVDTTIELGKADLSVALIFAMHCQQVAAVVRHGSERLRKELLPAVAAGQVYIASVTTETGKGRHLLVSESPSEQIGNERRIERHAPVVTGGSHADGFLITVQSSDTPSPAKLDLIYADRDQLHISVLGDWAPLGMRATDSRPLQLVGSVPAWQVIGEPGGFRTIAIELFAPLAHIGWSAAWLGTAAGAFARVVRHFRSDAGRKQVDPASELLRIRLADIRARLDVVHALLRHTISAVQSSTDVTAAPVQLLVNTLKTEAATGCFAAVDGLVELTGLRHGYLTGSPLRLERAFRDLRSASLNYSNDRLRLANGSLALMDTGPHLV